MNTNLNLQVVFQTDHVMLSYTVKTGLIQFAFHLVQIPDFAIGKAPHTLQRAYSMLYCWCDTGYRSSFTNSSPLIDSLIRAKVFKFWFANPKNFILLLYCPVFVHLGPLEPFDIG